MPIASLSHGLTVVSGLKHRGAHTLFIWHCVFGVTLTVLGCATAARAQYQLELPQIDLLPEGPQGPGLRPDPWGVVRPQPPAPPPSKQGPAPRSAPTPFELCTRAPAPEDALTACTEVAADENESAPRRAEAYLIRSRAYEAQGQTVAAIADLTAILELTPGSATAHFRRGQLWMREQNFDQAIKDYSAAITASPRSSLEFLIARGVAYRGKKDLKRSLADFDRVIAAKSKSTIALAHYERALTHVSAQENASALQDLRIALEINPNFALAHYAIGNIQFAQRDVAAALRSYEEALRLDPATEYYVVNARGIAQQHQGDCKGAIESFTKALNQNPKSQVILRNRANCSLRIGKYDDAIRDFTQALYATPENADLFAERAGAFLQKRDRKTAQRDVDQALKLDPHNPTALRNSARLKALGKDLKGALSDLETAQIAHPVPESAAERIWLHVAAGDEAGAAREIRTVLAQNPNDPAALYARGYQLIRAGRGDAGRNDLVEAIKRDPELTNRIAYLELRF